MEAHYRSEIEDLYTSAKLNLSQKEDEVFDEFIEGCFGVSNISKRDVIDFMDYLVNSITVK